MANRFPCSVLFVFHMFVLLCVVVVCVEWFVYCCVLLFVFCVVGGCLLSFVVVVRVGGVVVGFNPPSAGTPPSPPLDRPKFRSFFFPSPAPHFRSFYLSGGLFVVFLVVFGAPPFGAPHPSWPPPFGGLNFSGFGGPTMTHTRSKKNLAGIGRDWPKSVSSPWLTKRVWT